MPYRLSLVYEKVSLLPVLLLKRHFRQQKNQTIIINNLFSVQLFLFQIAPLFKWRQVERSPACKWEGAHCIPMPWFLIYILLMFMQFKDKYSHCSLPQESQALVKATSSSCNQARNVFFRKVRSANSWGGRRGRSVQFSLKRELTFSKNKYCTFSLASLVAFML